MGTEPADFATSWRSIDGQPGDPDYFVKFMDKMNGLGFFQQLKHRCIDLLEVEKGDRVIDVGCGAGDEARVLARIVGASGRVVGIDASDVMLKEARRRTSGPNLAIEYRHGDAHALQLTDASFDRCCSFGLLEVADDPKKVLAEMVRVTRSGGRIATPVFDLDTMMIDSSFRNVTRRLTHNYCDSCNGWLGRQLPAIMRELGVAELVITPMTLITTDYSILQELWLPPMIEDARRSGAASPAEIDDWLADLEARDRKGCFFWTATAVIVAGRKV
ncbi:MAG TPA: methyltransferase domain-containing protein [Blastocatellia bacterium]|nr:methyltransferase domain-containing protein [Blastocatellia bacterium]